jgi:hypothetical protein
MFFALFYVQQGTGYYSKLTDNPANSGGVTNPWVDHLQNADNLLDHVRHKM